MIYQLALWVVMKWTTSKVFRLLVKVGTVVSFLAFVTWYSSYQINKATQEAYKRGYEAAYAEVAINNKSQSERIVGRLEAIFDKHTQTIMESLQKDKEQRDEISKLLQAGVYVDSNCHEPNGIRLLNDQIRSRYKQPEITKPTK